MGKIQSVTSSNVAEYVNDRKALGSEVKTPEQAKQEDAKIAVEGVKPAETAPPEISKPAEQDKGKDKNSVQERINELTRQKRELEEFAESEYESRIQTQRRITELEAQLQAIQSPPKKEELEPKPGDAQFLKEDGSVDQDKFLAEWGKWNRNKAIEEFKAQEEKQKKAELEKALISEVEARKLASLEAARKEFPDFDEKIQEARDSVNMKRRESPNEAVQTLLSESDYGAHILYHLTQHPEDVEKWNKMRPSQVAIAIGRLETKFQKPVETSAAGTSTTTTLKPNLPEPTPSLGSGAGAITVDLNAPMDFRKYKEKRLEEIRKKRR